MKLVIGVAAGLILRPLVSHYIHHFTGRRHR
jgi:hypothetical protein